jgi:competence protein ComEC
MRASGLAHLLSVSGLHISAVVAAAFFMSLRLLALSPRLALDWPLLTISAAIAAIAGIGYTLLTGAEVPTIRSCIAAILVLVGMVLGRDAMTLRLVATGALVVLLLWPEALVGPSFQLSFAAITAIVALHESRHVQGWLSPREESLARKWGRGLCSLLLTGLVVEVVLAPIALFHFHKSGLYGALANMVAIPLTTFVIMPAEALALVADMAGLGAPFWWVTGRAIAVLLWLSHVVANQPGAVAMLPSISNVAYALMISGGLWIMLWRSRLRLAGLVPIMLGAGIALAAPAPDLLVTDDGRHLAVRDDAGRLAILRPKSGDFVRQVLAERSAYAGELDDLDNARHADCSADACVIRMDRGGRDWTVLAIRSRHRIEWRTLTEQCARSDIVVSDRWLPRACLARWLTIDPRMLRQTGGLAIALDPPSIETVRTAQDDHPWMAIPLSRQ